MPKVHRWLWVSLLLGLGPWAMWPPSVVTAPLAAASEQSAYLTEPQWVRVAVIGDYGVNQTSELEVANLVHSWRPDVVITTGDNNYPAGETTTIDPNIGQYYFRYIYPYIGAYGTSQPPNRFFPALGNHDWGTPNVQPYLNYFLLPGNERYYNFTWGPVEFFAVDSDPSEPDGVTVTSTQAVWLQNALGASTAPWRLVYFHHPAYSSGAHGSTPHMQWPFHTWGASGVLAGHEHLYERIVLNNNVYFTVGTGGAPLYNFNAVPVTGSVVRYNADYGAMLITATPHQITYQFVNRLGQLIDTYSQVAPTSQLFLPYTGR